MLRAKFSVIAFAIAATSALALVPGCGGPRTFQMRGSQRDPGADAQLQIEHIEGGNLVTISATNLAPPERVSSGTTRYVVWFRAGSSPAVMEAVLSYDPDSRTGRATAHTPHDRFTVLITAERAAQPGNPSEYVVFQQNVTN